MNKLIIDWCGGCQCWSIICPDCGVGSTCNGIIQCDTCEKIHKIAELIPFQSELDHLITQIITTTYD